ncbi:hypothetical protein ACYOEI_35515 [Singulisphaera rosea]
MRTTTLRTAIFSTLWLAAAGCASQPEARYVYQDGEFGVIGIPRNSPYGKKDFRKQAQDLMAQHFPDGYEIVRAEEVVEGQRVLDTGRKTEFETEPALNALTQMIKLGKLDHQVSLQQKDQVPILESRIIYKRRMAEGPRGVAGFSALSSTTPRFYLDPNEMARCDHNKLLADVKKAVPPAKANDPGIQKAAANEPAK